MTTAGARTGRGPSRPVVVGALALGGAAVVRVGDPVHHDLPLCPFRALTGLWCPLCGGLRATYELTHLHLAAAVRDNLLLVAGLPLLLLFWLDWLRRDRAGRPERRFPRAVLTALWAVALLFTVVRNVIPELSPA